MADENKEIPEKPQKPPLSSMFDRWQNDATSSPRDIPSEVRDEMNSNEIGMSPETKEDIVRRLARGFDEQLREYAQEHYKKKLDSSREKIVKKIDDEESLVETAWGNDYMFMLVHNKMHWQQNERVKTPQEEQFIELDLIPSPEVANGQEPIRTATTPYGIMPVFFIGSDRKRYQAKNIYKLNPSTGKGSKLEQIFKSGDDTYGGSNYVNEDMLDSKDFELKEPYESREVPLDGGDFELLKNILSRMESGEISYERPDRV